jgi:uracil-DNA glycosylase
MAFATLTQIQKQVVSCTKCELCKTRTNAVPGKGNENSEIVFIGEAPGKNEDRLGEPFVGVAGKKLSEALESAGISRETVYITNVVKCRPPNNRVPSTQETESCNNYLNAELELIKPKIICVMGNTAYHSLLGGGNIIKNRGKFLKKDGRLYFITIHPAATIYNQDLIKILKKDMKTLMNSLSDLKEK